ncbi:hypothetical protein KKG77_03990 [bacterium]|nr:hypothetical protein [bacterium]
MKFFMALCFFVTLLMADNPKIYSVLGDGIYNNVGNVVKLKEMQSYADDKDKINMYVSEVYAIKKIGHALDQGDESIDKLDYLNKLRLLSKENDNYIRSAHSKFRASMGDGDSELFSSLINSGLIDTSRYKDEIINYYIGHVEEINPKGVIQNFVNEDKNLKRETTANQKIYKSKQQHQKDKIQRIRKQDEIEQKNLEESLQKELDKKKSEIRESQMKELSK